MVVDVLEDKCEKLDIYDVVYMLNVKHCQFLEQQRLPYIKVNKK